MVKPGQKKSGFFGVVKNPRKVAKITCLHHLKIKFDYQHFLFFRNFAKNGSKRVNLEVSGAIFGIKKGQFHPNLDVFSRFWQK